MNTNNTINYSEQRTLAWMISNASACWRFASLAASLPLKHEADTVADTRRTHERRIQHDDSRGDSPLGFQLRFQVGNGRVSLAKL
jgi:hypothetical protein